MRPQQFGIEFFEFRTQTQAEQPHMRQVEVEEPAEHTHNRILRPRHLILGIDAELDEPTEPPRQQSFFEHQRPAQWARRVLQDLARVGARVIRQSLVALPVDDPGIDHDVWWA